MSEYQCHEFVALDRRLTARQMAELRAISTRAQISPTRFWNEYHYGDLKADPAKLLLGYFDAYLYFANWGTRRFMLRLPARDVDVAALGPYLATRRARLTRAGAFAVLDFWSDDEDFRGDEEWLEFGGLAALTPLRMQILQGDLTGAYIAWLGSAQSGEVDEDVTEPPVPPGLASPAAPAMSLAELLRVDRDLIAAASEASTAPSDDAEALRAWVRDLADTEKDRWLLRAVERPELALGVELRAAFRKGHANRAPATQRTVGELLARAETLREARRVREAAAKKRTRAARARARSQALDRLVERQGAAWVELEKLIEARSYDRAVELAVDIRDLALRDGSLPEFDGRFAALKKAHGRRRGFFDRFKRRTLSR